MDVPDTPYAAVAYMARDLITHQTCTSLHTAISLCLIPRLKVHAAIGSGAYASARSPVGAFSLRNATTHQERPVTLERRLERSLDQMYKESVSGGP